jgi:hypothetical protein
MAVWVTHSSHTSARVRRMSDRLLDDFEQEQEENDGEDQADASAAVVAETGSHAITTKAEHKNQNDQKDKHYFLLHTAKIRPMEV